jgi:transcription elongation factor Elf1
MAEPEETRFNCPNCNAQYKVVRVEAPALANVEEITCVICSAPLQARDDKFVLKYFLVGAKPKRERRSDKRKK